MAIKDDIVKFLRTNTLLNRVNFSFGTFKVYPSAFQKDVANAVDSGEIKVRTKGTRSPVAGASYDMNYDSLELSPAFSIASPRDQAFLVHECTHAHLDIQNTGRQSGHENEAVCYLAEAVFLEAARQPPLGLEAIRVVSHCLAKKVLNGAYCIAPTDAKALTDEVAKNPYYSTKVFYNSNGFNRSWIHKILR
jgi:hypothetical protein